MPYLAQLCIDANQLEKSQKWIDRAFDEIEKAGPDQEFQLASVYIARAKLKIKKINNNDIPSNETVGSLIQSATDDLELAVLKAREILKANSNEPNKSAKRRIVIARQLIAKLQVMAGNPEKAVTLLAEIFNDTETEIDQISHSKILELKTQQSLWLGEAGDMAAAFEQISEVQSGAMDLGNEISHTQQLEIRRCKVLLLKMAGKKEEVVELIDEILSETDKTYRRTANKILAELNTLKSEILEASNNPQ